MNCDDLIEPINVSQTTCDNYAEKRERVLNIACSGKSKMYFGVDLTPEQAQTLNQNDVIMLHNRYEKVLGSQMTKSIGQSIIRVYAKVVSKVVCLDSEDELLDDLNKDPVIHTCIGEVSRTLYFKFGSLIAPLSASLITFNHINFSAFKNGIFDSARGDNDDCSDTDREPTDDNNSDEI